MTVPANSPGFAGRLVFNSTRGNKAVVSTEAVSVYKPSGFYVTVKAREGFRGRATYRIINRAAVIAGWDVDRVIPYAGNLNPKEW